MAQILYPTNDAQVHRHSSIDQFRDFFSVMVQGGWSPIVFDQLDGIHCTEMKTHPVIISWGNDLGYVFPDAHCSYASDHFVTVDKRGVEEHLLPTCMGGTGEMYQSFIDANAFVNFDDDTSLGVHNKKHLRVGLSYCLADETLPPVE